MSTTHQTHDDPSEWLHASLAALLSAPGPIHMPKLPLGMRGGPGPIDLFSTRFNQLFADDVDVTINGQKCDRDALKETIVKVKSQYKSGEEKGGAQETHQEHNHAACKLVWPAGAEHSESSSESADKHVDVSAQTTMHGSSRKVSTVAINTDVLR